MSSATPQVLRGAVSSVLNTYIAPGASPFLPRDPVCSAAHLTEHVSLEQTTGQAKPGGRAVYDLPMDVDGIKSLFLDVRLNSCSTPGGGGAATANNFGFVDYVGLAMIEEIMVRYGTERIQLIRPLEMFEKLQWQLDSDKRDQILHLIGGGMTNTQRYQACTRGRQQIQVPLLTLLGLHLGADLSQTIMQRAMTERIKIEIKFAPVETLFFANGTFSCPDSAVASATPSADTVFEEVFLTLEGVHLVDEERKAHEMIYKQPRRYMFREAQYCTPVRVPGATTLNGSVIDISLREINQPVVALYVIIRWAADVDRVVGGAGADQGRRLFNVRGWYNPGASATPTGQPIISHIEGLSGANIQFLKRTRVSRLLEYERARVYKGKTILPRDVEEIPGAAIPHVSFSHDPTKENAVLGFIDFAQMDSPKLRLTFFSQAVGGVATNATINAAATVDIGTNSDLEITVVADTFNQLNFARNAMARPLN